jgi:undecaprenyl-diphosphatase
LNQSLEKLLQLDANFSARLRLAEKPGPWRTLAIILAHSGDSWFWLPGLGILWLSGSALWKTTAIVMIIGIVITAVVVFLIKFTVRRQRPAGEWGEIYRKTDPHSFPSGHAARAMLLAVIAVGLGPAWFGWLLIIWAPLVILARVSMGVHYLSDVVAGSILGLLTGVLVLNIYPTI